MNESAADHSAAIVSLKVDSRLLQHPPDERAPQR
jgi:hypothetical protein